jgi:hypothetical protein
LVLVRFLDAAIGLRAAGLRAAVLRAIAVAEEAGRAEVDRTILVVRRAGEPADFAVAADAVVAAEVSAFAAVVMALVALFIACRAVDIVLADAVALVAAEVILADALVTFAAAKETVRLADALAGVLLALRVPRAAVALRVRAIG